MHRDFVPLLSCPGCRRPGLTLNALDGCLGPVHSEGVLTCGTCGRWFPISDHLLDLVPDALVDVPSRLAFWARHRERLAALGLDEFRPDHTPSGGALEVQSKQRQYFDGLAERVDEHSYQHFMGTAFWRAEDARLYERWLPQIAPGALVLDVGCGDGRTTFRLAERARVLAFDISTIQLRNAIERARREGLLDRFAFFVGDAAAFPVDDGSVDGVLMDGVLHHLPDPQAAVGEAGRVLKRGGRYFGKENNRTPLRPLFDWLQRQRPLWVEEAGPEQLVSPAAITAWARAAGIRLAAKPAVFLPPHAFGRLSETQARRVLEVTDRICGRIPFVKKWGGLLVIEGVRENAAAPLGNHASP